MRTKSRNVVASVSSILLLLFASPLQICFQAKAQAQQQNAPQPVSLKVNTKNIGGAFELTAETLLYGDVKVYLPDDMAAGDTISGTVVAEPKGNTEEERAKNQDTLEGLVVEIGDQKVDASKGAFKWVVPNAPIKLIRIIEVASGRELAKTPVSLITPMIKPPTSQTSQTNKFQLPAIGQQGRAVEIPGPFDGDFSNTTLNWKSATQNAESAEGGFRLLAESPRKGVFRSPTNVTGQVEINLKEGSAETKGTYRSVGVSLSAPKTNLLKGERTTVTVMVVGLEGIKQTIPLLLITQGVVQMDGGNSQFIPIPASGVTPAGIFTMTRTLTGQQSGGFSVTATIVVKPLETCLQDDKNGGTFLFNSAAGDYIFTQPNGATIDGKGTLAKKGCILTLTDNRLDRRVMGRLDSCENKGNATIELDSPKAKFNVTDKNTTDNTCATCAERFSRLSRQAAVRASEIFNQDYFVVLLVVDHLVNEVAGNENAEAAGTHALFLAHARVLQGVAFRVEKSRYRSFVTVQRFDGEAFAGVFDAIENDAGRA